MAKKIQTTETQLLLADMLLATAIKYLINGFSRIHDATEEELAVMRKEAEAKFSTSMEKLKNMGK